MPTPYSPAHDYSIQEYEDALNKLALIIQKTGDQYLCLFEALNRQYERRLKTKTTLDMVNERIKNLNEIRTQTRTHFGTP